MAKRYSFWTGWVRMSKPLIIQSASPPDSRGVFGPGAEALRVGIYARVSTHDQKTLPLQLSAMRDYAKKRNWTIAIEVQDVASGGEPFVASRVGDERSDAKRRTALDPAPGSTKQHCT